MTDGLRLGAGTIVSRETIRKLEEYTALLAKWTKSINLISPKTVPDIWDRHILDSAQLFELAPQNWETWCDLGSGGGLPAVVISILDQENRPITLVESDKRKCLFLNTVRRELSLNMTILNERIENAKVTPSTIVTARALAPLDTLLGHAINVLQPDGIALFAKGETYQQEIEKAQETWKFDLVFHTSQTHSNARVLEISRISRRES